MSGFRGQHQDVQHFEHQPLVDARNQIRLIRVQPCEAHMPDALLRLSVKSINREEGHKQYRALSYRWGDDDSLHVILMNDRAFKVQWNLFEFLKHVSRKQDKDSTEWDGWWWVDALCIQQNDGDEEKAIQIEGMRETYADALHTIVWLGPGRLEATRGMKALQSIVESCGPQISEESIKAVQNVYSANPEIIQSVDLAFGNAYWMRVWILQELAVSDADGKRNSLQPRILVVLGDFVITWCRFLTISHTLGHAGLPSQYEAIDSRFQKNLARLWNLGLLMDPNEGVARDSLSYLIRLASGAEASRPQDYVYALLGLTSSECHGEIRPTYNKSGCAVICQAIRRIAEESSTPSHSMFSVRWTNKCHVLADSAQHKPLDDGLQMRKKRMQCSGVYHKAAACSKDTCTGQHCDALEVCQKIAEELYRGWTVFTYLENSTSPVLQHEAGIRGICGIRAGYAQAVS